MFTDELEFIYIYLPNIKKNSHNKLNKLENILLVFNENINKSKAITKEDGIMEDYVKEAVDAS